MATNKRAIFTPTQKKDTDRHERAMIVELFGTLEWDDSVDHKEDRRFRDRKLGLID